MKTTVAEKDAEVRDLKQQLTTVIEHLEQQSIKELDQQLVDGLAQLAAERDKITQEIINITEMQRQYQQWQNAIIEIDNNQTTVALEGVLNGDQQALKNFLTEEGEIHGNYNLLTLAADKFFTGTFDAQKMKMLAYKAIDNLSNNSELFYLEPDAKNETFTGLFLGKYTNPKLTAEQEAVREEISQKLLKQCVKDAEIAIRGGERSDLQKLVTLGEPLLDMLTSSGQTLRDNLRSAGYDDLVPRGSARLGK